MFVAGNVAFAFILPEFSPRSGNNPAIPTAVHMPETIMNKDSFLVTDKNNIGMKDPPTARVEGRNKTP
jgi:hypothetical protein